MIDQLNGKRRTLENFKNAAAKRAANPTPAEGRNGPPKNANEYLDDMGLTEEVVGRAVERILNILEGKGIMPLEAYERVMKNIAVVEAVYGGKLSTKEMKKIHGDKHDPGRRVTGQSHPGYSVVDTEYVFHWLRHGDILTEDQKTALRRRIAGQINALLPEEKKRGR